MAVRIRLARYGRTHRPFYRVVAIDGREHREGKACEFLGTYDPMQADKNIQVNIERVHAWIEKGAEINHSVASLLNRFGYEAFPACVGENSAKKAAKAKAKRAARKKKDGKTFVKASRRSLNKHKASLKAVRMAELNKAAEAKAAAKAAEEAAANAEEASAE